MEVMRTIYGLDLVPTFSPNVEIAINVLEAKEIVFTLVTSKKY